MQQYVFADLDLAKQGLQEFTDMAEEPVNIISIAYGRDGVEYQYRRRRETVGSSNIVATAHPRTR